MSQATPLTLDHLVFAVRAGVRREWRNARMAPEGTRGVRVYSEEEGERVRERLRGLGYNE